ncbi:nitroreductase [Novosphingobium bradum]|uniref:Nitroreductase n=1 Tax=Novosphingobium bradum TaxID=1737444 RepID=A0ABV7IPT2_9SPHN
MNVTEAVRSRRSVRAFTGQPVPFETIRDLLEGARWAPSGCNFQPWEATVLTGEALAALQAKLLAAAPDDPLEYRFDAPNASPRHLARLQELGGQMYGAMAVGRGDADGRADFARQNARSFGAPVLLLAHFPKLMGPPQWSDVGMWLQTIMLLAREAGLDTCPQEYMGMYGRTIKAHLGLSDDALLFCGLALGYRDADAPVNQFERSRVALADQVTFAGFETVPA